MRTFALVRPSKGSRANIPRFIGVAEASRFYGGSLPAWRRWIWTGRLGTAVKRLGRRVVIDTETVEERLATTGQLSVDNGRSAPSLRKK